MDSQRYKTLYNNFSTFVKNHYSKNKDIQENIILKEKHTARVCNIMKQLTNSLDTTQNQKEIALTIALCHDIGRFPQIQKYNTFSDKLSENHSNLGINVIKKNNLLNNYSDYEQNIILNAIINHNALNLPDSLDKETLFHSKLIRDADKLDSLHVNIEYLKTRKTKKDSALELGLPDTPGYTKELIIDILNGRSIDYSKRQNFKDTTLGYLSWINDLNFTFSYKYLEEKQFIYDFFKFLPEDNQIEKVKNYILNLIKEKNKP